MAISSETSSVSYAGNNSTVTAYTLAFPFSGSTEIVVTHTTAAGVRSVLAITTGYTLHGDPTAGTGTLKTVAAIPVADSLLIERFTSAVQSLDSSSPAGSYPTSIETQLDRTTRAVQDNKRIATRNLARALRLPDGETAAELPAATLRAGEIVYFNATTGAVETKTPDEILALSSGAPDGIGIPAGGTTGQALVKTSATSYATEWGDVTTDPASLVTALAAATDEQAADMREGLGLPLGQVSNETIVMGPVLPRTIARRVNPASNSAFQLTTVTLGDSFATELAMERAGYVLGRTTSYGGGCGPEFLIAGTAGENAVSDFTRSPYGHFWEVEVGETVILPFTGDVSIRNFHVFYTAENGAGAFKVEQDIGAGYVSISGALDSVNTDNAGAITPTKVSHDFAASAKRKLRITGLSGTCRVWGFCSDDRWTGTGPSKGGFSSWNFAYAGIDVVDSSAVAQSFHTLLIGTLLPDFIVWKANDNYETDPDALPNLVAKVKTGAGGTTALEPDWIFIGPHPTNEGGGSNDLDLDPEQDGFLVTLARTQGATFVNSRTLFRSHTMLTDLSLLADGLHFGAGAAGGFVTVAVIAGAIDAALDAGFNNVRHMPVRPQFGSPSFLLDPSSTGAVNLYTFKSLPGGQNGTDIHELSTPNGTALNWKLGSWNRMHHDGVRWQFAAGAGGLGYSGNTTATRTAGAGFTFVGTGFTEPTFVVASKGSLAASTPIQSFYSAATDASYGTLVADVIQNGSYLARSIGAGLQVKTGTNSKIGTGATLVSGTVTVVNTCVTALSHIHITKTAHGGTGGVSYVVTKIAATSFTITAVDAAGATVTTDTSVFDWHIVERIA